jgi:RNA polymerase-binding transcription factor DksA
MSRSEGSGSTVIMPAQPTGTGGPYWRELLEASWQARLREVTELSLAYHIAAAADPRGQGSQEAVTLIHRTVAARRKLADIEEALGRLTAGNFGYCEHCRSRISVVVLADAPETRYCPGCAKGAAIPPAIPPAAPPEQRRLAYS